MKALFALIAEAIIESMSEHEGKRRKLRVRPATVGILLGAAAIATTLALNWTISRQVGDIRIDVAQIKSVLIAKGAMAQAKPSPEPQWRVMDEAEAAPKEER